jgi:hypothetical protein
MGKATYKGLVPQDDPMFSTGSELFSRPAPNAFSTNAPREMDGARQANSGPATEQVDEKADGEFRIAKYLHRNPEKMREALDNLRRNATVSETREAQASEMKINFTIWKTDK